MELTKRKGAGTGVRSAGIPDMQLHCPVTDPLHTPLTKSHRDSAFLFKCSLFAAAYEVKFKAA